MPAQPANVTVVVEAAVPRDFQAGLPVVVGYDSSYATANEPKKYFDPKTLVAAHGAATKTSKAGKALFKNGAQSVVVVKPLITAVVAESKGTSASGTLTNKPITKTTAPVVRVDDVAKTVVYKYETGSAFTALTPSAGTVHLNPYTGEYETGDSPETSVEFDYSYMDFAKLVDALNSAIDALGPYEIFLYPDLPAEAASYGDYKGLADKAEDEDWVILAHTANGATVATGKAFRAAVETPAITLVPHKDGTNDPAALVAGVVSRVLPWNTVAFKRIEGLDTDYYLPSEIGAVGTGDTFEGEGLNPIHRMGGRNVLTNERTAVAYGGAESEIYLSRRRTRIYLLHRLRRELSALLLTSPKIGFSARGVGQVTVTIAKVLENLVAEEAIERGYVITEPNLAAISAADSKARKLGPFGVSCKMVEGAHEIAVEITLEVA